MMRKSHPGGYSGLLANLLVVANFQNKYDLTASIFGTSRRGFKDKICKEAQTLGHKLAKAGFAVITGGGLV
jgi:predicted Rossmann-fold nucleotide-binding protein